mmetsp:Transcript_6579/g.9803  ORF Transcript_6579/g.9803 Transcript_6579/m.9803 type:complete len:246 (-) Transcript_6579:430-1167(-)
MRGSRHVFNPVQQIVHMLQILNKPLAAAINLVEPILRTQTTLGRVAYNVIIGIVVPRCPQLPIPIVRNPVLLSIFKVINCRYLHVGKRAISYEAFLGGTTKPVVHRTPIIPVRCVQSSCILQVPLLLPLFNVTDVVPVRQGYFRIYRLQGLLKKVGKSDVVVGKTVTWVHVITVDLASHDQVDFVQFQHAQIRLAILHFTLTLPHVVHDSHSCEDGLFILFKQLTQLAPNVLDDSILGAEQVIII